MKDGAIVGCAGIRPVARFDYAAYLDEHVHRARSSQFRAQAIPYLLRAVALLVVARELSHQERYTIRGPPVLWVFANRRVSIRTSTSLVPLLIVHNPIRHRLER